MRRLDLGEVSVLVGPDADALALRASELRRRELRRVALFVLEPDSGSASDPPALEAFCAEQFGTGPGGHR